MKKRLALFTGALALTLLAGQAGAKVSQEEADRLGKDLTPFGAERAGNKDGSIPEWTPAQRRGSLKGE